MYDVIIIGAGPGGMAAGIASVENKLNALVIAKAVFEPKPEEVALGVFKLKDLREKFIHLVKAGLLEFKDKTEVINLEKNIVSFGVEIKNGSIFYAKSIIIATGNNSPDFDRITQKTQDGKIKHDHSQKTSVLGVFACGQISVNVLVQIGEAVKAVETIKKL